MYCPKCGTQNSDDAESCNACGAILTPSPTAEPIMPKTSGLAIAAFVMGILSVFTCLLTGIPSIICGIIALVKVEKSGGKITGKGFAITGIITPVLSFALILVILLPALSRVRQQAKTVMCMANLRTLGLACIMYTDENEGSFISDENWPELMHPYMYDSNKMLLCPMANKSEGPGAGTTFTAWETPEGDIGSYGINGWAINPKRENIVTLESGQIENYWKKYREIRGPGETPLIMDCRQILARPLATDTPPREENTDLQNHMQRVCIDRHSGSINVAVMDGSVSKIGLKKLWSLNWHKGFNRANAWTRAGGVEPDDWPQWMRNFKDY